MADSSCSLLTGRHCPALIDSSVLDAWWPRSHASEWDHAGPSIQHDGTTLAAEGSILDSPMHGGMANACLHDTWQLCNDLHGPFTFRALDGLQQGTGSTFRRWPKPIMAENPSISGRVEADAREGVNTRKSNSRCQPDSCVSGFRFYASLIALPARRPIVIPVTSILRCV